MQKIDSLHASQQTLLQLGKLVQSCRSIHMDQKELATRVGVSRNTISAIENGKGTNSESLFRALEHLDLLQDFRLLIDAKLAENTSQLQRKARKPVEELSNDF